MKQELKSQHSRTLILQAGLDCFSAAGYKGTSIKDIALRAGISAGRVYHHFASKLEVFTALLQHYWEVLADPELELNRISAQARFPDDIPQLAAAIRQVVENNRASIMLIYIDVIEFHGEHINRFYKNMALRFQDVYKERFEELRREGRLNPKADPLFAVMMTYRFLFHYFLVECSFGVADHFGYSSEDIVEKVQETILHGLLRD